MQLTDPLFHIEADISVYKSNALASRIQWRRKINRQTRAQIPTDADLPAGAGRDAHRDERRGCDKTKYVSLNGSTWFARHPSSILGANVF